MSTYNYKMAAGQRVGMQAVGTGWFLRSVRPQVSIDVHENQNPVGQFVMGEGHYGVHFDKMAFTNTSALPCELSVWIGDGVFSGHVVGLPPQKGGTVRASYATITGININGTGEVNPIYLPPDSGRLALNFQAWAKAWGGILLIPDGSPGGGMELRANESIMFRDSPGVGWTINFLGGLSSDGCDIIEELW